MPKKEKKQSVPFTLHPFVCGLCEAKFNNMHRYYHHFEKHNEVDSSYFHHCKLKIINKTSKAVTCNGCKHVFPSVCQLDEHYRACQGIKSYSLDIQSNTAVSQPAKCKRKRSHVSAKLKQNISKNVSSSSNPNSLQARNTVHNKTLIAPGRTRSSLGLRDRSLNKETDSMYPVVVLERIDDNAFCLEQNSLYKQLENNTATNMNLSFDEEVVDDDCDDFGPEPMEEDLIKIENVEDSNMEIGDVDSHKHTDRSNIKVEVVDSMEDIDVQDTRSIGLKQELTPEPSIIRLDEILEETDTAKNVVSSNLTKEIRQAKLADGNSNEDEGIINVKTEESSQINYDDEKVDQITEDDNEDVNEGEKNIIWNFQKKGNKTNDKKKAIIRKQYKRDPSTRAFGCRREIRSLLKETNPELKKVGDVRKLLKEQGKPLEEKSGEFVVRGLRSGSKVLKADIVVKKDEFERDMRMKNNLTKVEIKNEKNKDKEVEEEQVNITAKVKTGKKKKLTAKKKKEKEEMLDSDYMPFFQRRRALIEKRKLKQYLYFSTPCPLCFMFITSRRNGPEKHKALHESEEGKELFADENLYQCQSCGAVLQYNKDQLSAKVQHICKSEAVKKIFERAGMEFKWIPALNKTPPRIKKKPIASIVCYKCGLSIKRSNYKNHVAKHNVKELKPFTCIYCTRPFKTLAILKAHKRKIHFKKAPAQRELCHKCGQEFDTKTKLSLHIRDTHKETPDGGLQCPTCQMVFTKKGNLTRHKELHMEPTIPCPYCPKMYMSDRRLRKHVGLSHTPKTRQWVCTWPECGDAFFTSVQLRNHMLRHTGEKRFVCKLCGCDYITRTELTLQHLKKVHNVTGNMDDYVNKLDVQTITYIKYSLPLRPGEETVRRTLAFHPSLMKKFGITIPEEDVPTSETPFENNSSDLPESVMKVQLTNGTKSKKGRKIRSETVGFSEANKGKDTGDQFSEVDTLNRMVESGKETIQNVPKVVNVLNEGNTSASGLFRNTVPQVADPAHQLDMSSGLGIFQEAVPSSHCQAAGSTYSETRPTFLATSQNTSMGSVYQQGNQMDTQNAVSLRPDMSTRNTVNFGQISTMVGPGAVSALDPIAHEQGVQGLFSGGQHAFINYLHAGQSRNHQQQPQ